MTAIQTLRIISEPFGVTPAGRQIQLFSLANDQGMEVKVINYGGIITAINVPDRNGKLDDVVLGHNSLEGYLNRSRYFGALIGRHANRIACGKFVLNSVEHSLSINNGPNHLHGGIRGFDKVVWTPKETNDGLQLNYRSCDGEEGYPGNLDAAVMYALTDENELRIEYRATTNRDTIVNLTNHSYFNLSGSGTILDHEVQINADAFIPIDETLIPTGEISCVKDTPMDFTSATAVGARINEDDGQLRNAGGYDHNFVLRTATKAPTTAARVYDPKTGRVMDVLTTQPGLQFYSGNFLDGTIVGKSGRAYVKHSGCCLEPQHFPDAPNHLNFPSTVLKPAEEYKQTTVFRFSVK